MPVLVRLRYASGLGNEEIDFVSSPTVPVDKHYPTKPGSVWIGFHAHNGTRAALRLLECGCVAVSTPRSWVATTMVLVSQSIVL